MRKHKSHEMHPNSTRRDDSGRFGEGHAPRERDRYGTFKKRGDNLEPKRVESMNEKGASATLSCHVPIEIARKLSELHGLAITTGVFPWKTKGDVIRQMLVAGIEWFDKTYDPESTFAADYTARKLIEDTRAARDLTTRLYDGCVAEVDALLDIDKAEAQRVFQAFLEHVLAMGDTAWRNHLIDRLRAKFPTLLREGATANLTRRRRKEDILPHHKRTRTKTKAKPKRRVPKRGAKPKHKTRPLGKRPKVLRFRFPLLKP